MITVLRDRYVPAWPKRVRCTREERGYVMRAGAAFERTYSSDAHFVAYCSSMGRRLALESLEQDVAIELTHVVFDIDGPNHAVTPEWRSSLRDRVQALAAVHPAPYYYETRGGARLVYAQREPTIIRTRDDAREWKRVYSVALAYLARRFGIAGDPACADCTRLFRLPRATRELGEQPENLPTWGDPHRIGVLEINATHADVDVARASSKAFREPKARDVESTSTCDGYGVLYWALRLRGDIIADHSTGAYVVRCPREQKHTTGATGDGSTLLYLPDRGHELGHIHCLHSHCAELSPKEWLTEFSEAELDAARERAGIRRERAA